MTLPHFINDAPALPTAKVDKKPVSDPARQWSAADAAFTWGALADVRSDIQTNPVHVKAYGAKGDYNLTTGTGTDDRAAFIAAIAAAMASGGKRVRIPDGVYLLSKAIRINGAVGLQIEASANAYIVYPSDSLALVPDATFPTYALIRSGLWFVGARNCSVTGLNFIGGSSPNLTSVNNGYGLYATHSTGLRITRCTQVGGGSLFGQDAMPNTTGNVATFAVSAGIVTLTNDGNLSGTFNPSMVGRQIAITNAVSPANNGLFDVLSVANSTTLTYRNVDAVVEAAPAAVWVVNDADDDTVLSECVMSNTRWVAYTGSGGTFSRCKFIRPATQDATGIPDSFTRVGTTTTLTDAQGKVSAAMVGKRIKIGGATSSANNGLFPITAVTPGTNASPATISYTNGSGVSELAPARDAFWWVAGGERSGVGNGASAIASASGVVTFTASTALFRQSDRGKVLCVSDATTAANNGPKVISRVISGTQVQYIQSNAVSEAFAGDFTIDGYDNCKSDGVIGPTINSTSSSVAANTLTDGAQSMVTNAYAGKYLQDSAGKQWLIDTNTSTVFTLVGGGAAPAAGAYFVSTSDTHGSSHAIYIFAGRSRIKVVDCVFENTRTIGVKWSGSSAPLSDIEISGNSFVDCGSGVIGGADDVQEHTGLKITNNRFVNCATGRLGWNDQYAVCVFGARAVHVRGNHFHATRDNVQALVNGGAIGGYSAVFVGRYTAGVSGAVEDIAVDDNTFTHEPGSSASARITSQAITLLSVGQRAKWRSGGTLSRQSTGSLTLTVSTASTGSVTRGAGSFIADGFVVGGAAVMSGFVNGGNNVTKTISTVTATVLTFTANAGLVNETHAGSISNNVMTLTDSQAAFSQADVGASLEIPFAPDAGNSSLGTTASTPATAWTVTGVSGSNAVTFVNPAGVAGNVAPGTYRIKPRGSSAGGVFRGAGCVVARNKILGYGVGGVLSTQCVAPQIVDNTFSGMSFAVFDDGSVTPRIARNTEVQGSISNNPRIALTSRTAWPVISADNYVTNGALTGGNLVGEGAASRSDMGVSLNNSASIDHPLLGERGRCKPTDGKAEVVWYFGCGWVDGDQVGFNGAVYTFKRVSPSFAARQFNGMIFGAGSNVNEYGDTITQGLLDGDAGANWTGISSSGFVGEDYGTGLAGSIATGAVRWRLATAGATADAGYIDTINILNQTACVVLRNSSAGSPPESFAFTRAPASSGSGATAVADGVVIWSPCAHAAGGGFRLWANNAAARKLLADGAPATGLITCVAKASYTAGVTDFMTIGDGLVAPVRYYFDTVGAGGGTGTQVNISTDTTAAQVAARLRTAIGTVQPSLTVVDNTDGTLTITHKIAGAVGNVTMTENVTNAGHTVRGLANGLPGGWQTARVQSDGGACEVFVIPKSTDDAGASLGAEFRFSN